MYIHLVCVCVCVCVCLCRCAGPVGGAAAMSGAADRDASPAAPGPAGLLQEEVGDRDGVFPEPGEARREVHGQNTQHERPSAIQVGRRSGTADVAADLF